MCMACKIKEGLAKMLGLERNEEVKGRVSPRIFAKLEKDTKEYENLERKRDEEVKKAVRSIHKKYEDLLEKAAEKQESTFNQALLSARVTDFNHQYNINKETRHVTLVTYGTPEEQVIH